MGELERKLRKGWRKLRPFERLEQLKSVRHLWYGRFPNSDEACRHVYDRGRYWNPLCLELPEFKQFEDVPEISGLVWQQPGCPPLRVRTVDLENLGITETEVYACAGRNLRQLYTQARLRPVNSHFQLEVGESMEGSFREVAGFWQDRKELVGVPVVAKVSSEVVLVADSEKAESIQSMRAALESILAGKTRLETLKFGSWREYS